MSRRLESLAIYSRTSSSLQLRLLNVLGSLREKFIKNLIQNLSKLINENSCSIHGNSCLKTSVKAAIKREKSDACISFSEREQTRPKVKSVSSVGK